MKNSLLYGIWKHFPHMFCTHLSSVLAPYLICCTWKTTHKTIRKVCSSSFTTTQKQTYTYSSPSHPSRDMFCVLPKTGDKKLLRFSTHNKSKLLLPIEHAVWNLALGLLKSQNMETNPRQKVYTAKQKNFTSQQKKSKGSGSSQAWTWTSSNDKYRHASMPTINHKTARISKQHVILQSRGQRTNHESSRWCWWWEFQRQKKR